MMEQTALCRAWHGILATDLYAFLERAFRDIDQRLNLIPAPYVELLTSIRIFRGRYRAISLSAASRNSTGSTRARNTSIT